MFFRKDSRSLKVNYVLALESIGSYADPLGSRPESEDVANETSGENVFGDYGEFFYNFLSNSNFAVVTFTVDFWQLPKVIFFVNFRRPHCSITVSAKNFPFGNCQKSTANVTPAKFAFPNFP